jgi:hydrogenase small subunit
MKISRRDFLKWCSASAAALSLSKFDLDRLESVVLAAETSPPVIWLQGSGCSGCSISLLNTIESTTIDDLLLNKISMKYHHNIMTAAGDLAISAINQTMSSYNGQFILVIEGGIPTGSNGMYCVLGERNGAPWTILDAVKELGPKAKYVISAGTCASFGGAPSAGGNPTGIQSLSTILGSTIRNKVINLPGCPVHPYTLTKTIIDLLLYGMPSLDTTGRPIAFYSNKIHSLCPRKGAGKAKALGGPGCYNGLGCSGPGTQYDCPTRKWNNKTNWCIGAGQLCIGCAGSTFAQSSFYKF